MPGLNRPCYGAAAWRDDTRGASAGARKERPKRRSTAPARGAWRVSISLGPGEHIARRISDGGGAGLKVDAGQLDTGGGVRLGKGPVELRQLSHPGRPAVVRVLRVELDVGVLFFFRRIGHRHRRPGAGWRAGNGQNSPQATGRVEKVALAVHCRAGPHLHDEIRVGRPLTCYFQLVAVTGNNARRMHPAEVQLLLLQMILLALFSQSSAVVKKPVKKFNRSKAVRLFRGHNPSSRRSGDGRV